MGSASGLEIAIGGSGIARSSYNGLALCIGLLHPSLHGVRKGGPGVRFAESIAVANYRGDVLIDGILQRVKGPMRAIGTRLAAKQAGIDQSDAGILRHAARPFHVQIGFAFISRTTGGSAGAG